MKQQTIIFIAFLFFLSFYACNGENEKKKEKEVENKEEISIKSLNKVASYKIDVPEPSGLSFSEDDEVLYTVSDKTNKIYKISTKGELISIIDCKASDLEGICYDTNNKFIWIAEERNRKIVKLDTKGNIIDGKSLEIQANDENKGIEGITINKKNGYTYCVNEGKPGLLIELDENQKKINEYELNFAEDYSGIFYDSEIDKVWIISDKSKTITKCDLKGNEIETYKLGIKKAEGVVVDSKNKLIYVVSDKKEKLYVFEY